MRTGCSVLEQAEYTDCALWRKARCLRGNTVFNQASVRRWNCHRSAQTCTLIIIKRTAARLDGTNNRQHVGLHICRCTASCTGGYCLQEPALLIFDPSTKARLAESESHTAYRCCSRAEGPLWELPRGFACQGRRSIRRGGESGVRTTALHST